MGGPVMNQTPDHTGSEANAMRQAVNRINSWGVQVMAAEEHALANAAAHGHLSDLMSLVRRAWETPSETAPPVIPDQIRWRREVEERRSFPSHRAEKTAKPAPVVAFERRAEQFTQPRWEFAHDGFRCLRCGTAFCGYTDPDAVPAAAESHALTCPESGGVA